MPNVVIVWLALPLRMREVLGLNLGSQAGYPDRGFVIFLSLSK